MLKQLSDISKINLNTYSKENISKSFPQPSLSVSYDANILNGATFFKMFSYYVIFDIERQIAKEYWVFGIMLCEAKEDKL